MRKLRWSVAMTATLMLVLTGTAVAKPPSPDPPPSPVITIDSLELDCETDGNLAVTAAVTAGEQTRLDEVRVFVQEIRFVPAGMGGYFPYDTMLPVAQWGEGISSREGPGKPSSGLTSPTTLELKTAEGTDHYWNIMLSNGTPAVGSWFEVQTGGYGQSTQRDGGWAVDERTDFINCGTDEVMVEAAFPWNDWNYPEEG